MHTRVLTLAAGLLLASAAVVASPSASSAEPTMIQVPIMAQNSSGETGFVTIETMDNGSQVTLHVMGLPGGASQRPIHGGTCANLMAAPAFPLSNVTAVDTMTMVPATLRDLMSKPYAINLHRAADDLPSYVACADLSWGM